LFIDDVAKLQKNNVSLNIFRKVFIYTAKSDAHKDIEKRK